MQPKVCRCIQKVACNNMQKEVWCVCKLNKKGDEL